MGSKNDDLQELFICQCSSCEHQMIMSTVDYDLGNEVVYCEMHLAKNPLWERIKYALRYVFGYKCKYGAFEEMILRPEDADRLQRVVDLLKKNSDGQG